MKMDLSKFNSLEMQELMRDPSKYNAPTWEEFKKNPDKYLGKSDQVLATVDKGSHNLQRVVEKYVYEIEGFRCNTLEEVERIAGDYGIPLKQLDYRPELIPQGGGKSKMLVKFVSKDMREKRALW